MPGFWARWRASRDAAAAKHVEELEQMSPEERAFAEGSPEGRASDEQTQALLGGTNPKDLLGDE